MLLLNIIKCQSKIHNGYLLRSDLDNCIGTYIHSFKNYNIAYIKLYIDDYSMTLGILKLVILFIY